MSTYASASDLGRAFYRGVWQLVDQTFFDRSRLANWGSFEHKFDDEIVDEETALRCIDEMLASLKDDFTWAQLVPAASGTAGNDAELEPVLAVLRPDGIGYLGISTLDCPNILDLIDAGAQKIAACKGVILDLRNNLGGDVQTTAAACGSFLPDGLVATMEMRHESGGIHRSQYALSEDEFFCNEFVPGEAPTSKRWVRSAPVLAGKPIVILINTMTMSAAELMVAAIVQNGTGKVTIVGNGPTPGKGIGQTGYLFLDGKYRVRVTRVRWYAPGGDWLGDCGQTVCNPIEPNVLVPDDRGRSKLGLQVAFKELRKLLDEPQADSETTGPETADSKAADASNGPDSEAA